MHNPLHLKYRPQCFNQLVGQDAISATLSNALLQNHIAPAYLFTGSRGTGKTSSVRIFAKSLNCLSVNAPTDQPCGVCQTCREITTGTALDVIEIDAASNSGVDRIRELIERAQFAPVRCRYKVYVIDEAHCLSSAAFNALLKTLEEPPERVAVGESPIRHHLNCWSTASFIAQITPPTLVQAPQRCQMGSILI